MATNAYIAGRKQYSRPHAMMWSKNEPLIINGKYVPYGLEMNDAVPANTAESLQDQFLILSDDNRQPLAFKTNRIQTRKRMVNGQMRSYHIADKMNISVSWNLLPSRGFATYPSFDTATGKPDSNLVASQKITSDGGAGGVDIVEWYENNQGSFWVYLSYDKYNEFAKDSERYERIAEYPQALEMYVSSFDYDVVKRGGNHDLWNISISLEEV
jgi:hypothetical protein